MDSCGQSFIVNDSGERRLSPTGMMRDMGNKKPRPDYISPIALMEVGEHMRLGAIKYAPYNWAKGMSFSDTTGSMFRHMLAWIEGENTENHLAAVIFNAMCLIHWRAMIKRGLMDASLNDMPFREVGCDVSFKPEATRKVCLTNDPTTPSPAEQLVMPPNSGCDAARC